jgi:hypothetical protein
MFGSQASPNCLMFGSQASPNCLMFGAHSHGIDATVTTVGRCPACPTG